jgi:glycosyltransferase involved in cell wall biosynthesis
MLDQITPMLLTFNEAPNLRRTLQKLSWAREILVVDSFSTDETLAILKTMPQARLVQRSFDSFAGQCNSGLQSVRTEWVLSLDADYVLSDQFRPEIAQLDPPGDVAGYRAGFTYCIQGRPLRASLYPPRTVLYRKARACYQDEGHGHRVQIDGQVLPLHSAIFHDDRKSLDRWFSEQFRYAAREARHLLSTPPGQLNRPDRLRRRILFAPALVFLFTLFGRGLILDGWPGWYYVLQRTVAELILSLKLIEQKLAK